jgi:hypothetical protein
MVVVASEQQNNWSIKKPKEKRKKDRIINKINKRALSETLNAKFNSLKENYCAGAVNK